MCCFVAACSARLGLIEADLARPWWALVEWHHEREPGTPFALQHPAYVIDGKPVNLGNGPRAQRTFVLTDGAGWWVIGVCSAIGLQEMADLLATPGVMGDVKVARAMNLDGGPSTALWCRDTSGAEHYTKESWRVKNLLAVEPRK